MDRTNSYNPQDARDPSDWNSVGRVLRVAAINGDIGTARMVLATSSDTTQDFGGADAPDGQGYTPLMLAAKYSHLPLVRLLCENGADPNRCNIFGQTALSFTNDSAIIFALLEHGGHITTGLLEGAIANDDEDLLLTLLERCRSGADSYRLEETALLSAAVMAGKNNEHWVRLLLEHGADGKESSNSGNSGNSGGRGGLTPLMEAAQWGELTSMRLLLDAGADVNATTKDEQRAGKTALMLAAERQMDAAVDLLLEYGADVNVADEHGRTPLLYAFVTGSRFGYRPPSSNIEPFPRPFPQQAPSAALYTEEDQAALSAMGVLMAATGTAEERIVYSLLEHGADAKAADVYGGTALHQAYSATCTRWLLAAGADLEARDKSGWTPALSAASDGRLEALEVLVKAGANVHAVCLTTGEGALTLALRSYAYATNPGVLRDYPDPDEAVRLQATIDWLRKMGVREQQEPSTGATNGETV